ncbi:MAG TPA: hypothetical protein VLI39_15435 [Sedimentisphaerales bacterium]|nr:hypothetical protein [Sedimentisphaerales bacterium]
MDRTRLSTVLCVVWLFGMGPTCMGGQDPVVASESAGPIVSYEFLNLDDPCAVRDADNRAMLTFGAFDAYDGLLWAKGFANVDAWVAYARNDPCLAGDKTRQVGWTLSQGKEDIFWQLQAIVYLCPECRNLMEAIESRPAIYDGLRRIWLTPRVERTTGDNRFDLITAVVFWNPSVMSALGGAAPWDDFPPLAALAHELVHAYQRVVEDRLTYTSPLQVSAVKHENLVRQAFLRKVPGYERVQPRPGNAGFYLGPEFQYLFDTLEWGDWSPSYVPLLDVFVEP